MSASFDNVDEKLREADFFLTKMEESGPDTYAFRFYFSAFVTAARSVTFAMQSAMSDIPEFAAWYSPRQDRLRADPVSRFFISVRNEIQKRGTNPVAAFKQSEGAASEAFFVYWYDDPEQILPDTDVVSACKGQMKSLARLVYEVYRDFGHFIDPAIVYRVQEATRAYDAAKAELRLAEARLAKAEAARTKIAVANKDLEAARILVAKASKALDLAKTGYDQIREVELMVGVKKEMVKDAQIALDTAQHQLQFTQVRAPFPGVVVKRFRNLSDFASPGVTILSMYNPDLIYVTANLEEDRLRGVAPGNPVELQLDALAEPFRGRVVWIDKSTGAQFALMPRNVVSGEFTKVVQRVPVRIAIEMDERWPLLRAGFSVRAAIGHGEGDPAWAEQTAREMRDLETQYNLPQRPDRAAGPGDQP
jgi:hypothetical protein